MTPKGNHKFRVRIEIESVADDEVSRPQEKINSVWNENGVFQYDPDCQGCKTNTSHFRHRYMTPIEKTDDYISDQRKVTSDYASCNHVWTLTSDGMTICDRCKNIKLTRGKNAEVT